MPLLRVFKTGINLAMRAKVRALIFIVLFTLVTTSSFLQSAKIYSYETSDLLRLKGIVLEPEKPLTADKLDAKIRDIYDDARDILSGIYVVYGLTILDDQLLIVTVRDYRNLFQISDLPWVVSEFKPTSIIAGRYISGPEEGIINTDFAINFYEYGTPMSVHLTVGDTISFQAGYREINVRIVGITGSDLSSLSERIDMDVQNVLFVHWDTFERIASDVEGISGPIESSSRIYVLRVIFIVKGSILTVLGGDIFAYRNSLKDTINEYYDNAYPLRLSLLEEISPGEFQNTLLIFLLSMVFQIVVAGIYAVLLIKLHRKDIATLRALGWDSRHIKIFAIGAFISTLLIGFVIGIIAGGIYAIVVSKLSLDIIPFIVLFVTNLLIPLLIGMKYTSAAALSIPPSEAFRRE